MMVKQSILPEWRNWQTRQVEGLVTFTGRAGSSPVSGIQTGQGVTANPGLLPCAFNSELGKVLVKRFA
jgi:hypothetical protein